MIEKLRCCALPTPYSSPRKPHPIPFLYNLFLSLAFLFPPFHIYPPPPAVKKAFYFPFHIQLAPGLFFPTAIYTLHHLALDICHTEKGGFCSCFPGTDPRAYSFSFSCRVFNCEDGVEDWGRVSACLILVLPVFRLGWNGMGMDCVVLDGRAMTGAGNFLDERNIMTL